VDVHELQGTLRESFGRHDPILTASA
jgi:hypothetical protein